MPFINSVRGSFGPQGAFGSNKLNATGGTSTTLSGYRYHTFTSTGNSTLTFSSSGTIDYLIIAGGGAGGSSTGGGGGAGGLLYGSTTVTPQAYTVTVGAGGTAQYGIANTDGLSSSAFGLTAVGGGGGGGSEGTGSISWAGRSGGSGGGGQSYIGNTAPGSGTVGQGYMGNYTTNNQNPGGGGGAGSGGNQNIYGNPGLQYSTFATATSTGVAGYFAGGGGAGSVDSAPLSTGGAGGGGNWDTVGAANTGGGGGGNWTHQGSNGSNGGSGIVIVRYLS